MMKSKRQQLYLGTACLSLAVALSIGMTLLKAAPPQEAGAMERPLFQVDPTWPKPLPNGWTLGQAIGISVDSQDNIWMLNRPRNLVNTQKNGVSNGAKCCKPGPAVMEFNQTGDLLRSWGGACATPTGVCTGTGDGPGYEWVGSEHGLHLDSKDNVWIGGNGPKDAHVLKFTRDGKFLLQIGKLGKTNGSNDPENFGRATNFEDDPTTNEIYVSDGYINHRVWVGDADTGKMKRMWGAYGVKVVDDAAQPAYKANQPPAKQFSATTHCSEIDKDGLVYVCDRTNDRFQVFQKDGTYVKEVFVEPQTMAAGTVCEIAFSRDAEQRWVYITDLTNMEVVILDRKTLKKVGAFGTGGHGAGQFDAPHSIDVDSHGNIFISETFSGQRGQKFVYKGIGK